MTSPNGGAPDNPGRVA